jgi:hypothetical protein
VVKLPDIAVETTWRLHSNLDFFRFSLYRCLKGGLARALRSLFQSDEKLTATKNSVKRLGIEINIAQPRCREVYESVVDCSYL